MDKKVKFEGFLESLKGNGQDVLIESVKKGFRVCFEEIEKPQELMKYEFTENGKPYYAIVKFLRLAYDDEGGYRSVVEPTGDSNHEHFKQAGGEVFISSSPDSKLEPINRVCFENEESDRLLDIMNKKGVSWEDANKNKGAVLQISRNDYGHYIITWRTPNGKHILRDMFNTKDVVITNDKVKFNVPSYYEHTGKELPIIPEEYDEKMIMNNFNKIQH